MNIVILSIGRSGSTIAARMLEALGWQLGVADEEYAEHEWFRAINDHLVRGEPFPAGEAEELLESLPEPWLLKDPRLARTWETWQPLLDCGALLLWITRDLAAVEKSLRAKRWGQPSPRGLLLRGRTLAETEAECRRCFDAWAGPRCKTAYEDLHRAVGLFDLGRG